MDHSSHDPAQALRAALDGHDSDRRGAFAGVTLADLDADKQLGFDIGEAIAALARTIASRCRASAFCVERPATTALCARLVEAVDDQVDGAAWAVIAAAARAAAR